MSIEFNKSVLNGSYKLIWLDCMNDGLTIPYLIKKNVDKEYYPNQKDRSALKLSKKQKTRLQEAYYNRRLKEHKLWNSTNNESKRLRLIEEYMENEVTSFLKKYSKYNKIIK